MRPIFLTMILLQIMPQTWAFSWNDVWSTPDHQAQIMMNKGQFSKAQATFDNPNWQAFAAFRAGHYKKAASLYGQLKNDNYNQGNALAYDGQLEAALQAYNKAIANNPTDQDALYNRKIIEELLKKKQQRQDQKNQEQKEQDKQNQEQKDQEQKKQEQQNQQQDKKDKQSETKPEQHSNQSPEEREQKQAKKQWLKLVPDDPGGLMREKFLRDYLRRQQR